MTFFNKLKWVLGIGMVFLLIAITNLIDRSNFNRIKESIDTIYEDRLVAKNFIYKMTLLVHEKEMAEAKRDTNFFLQDNLQIDNQLTSLLSDFEKTKLTKAEEKTISDLRAHFLKLKGIEKTIAEEGFGAGELLTEQLMMIKEDLRDLSIVQLEEGQRQMSISKRAIDDIELFTQVEIYFLAFLAVIIQLIIMSRPKKKA